MSFLSRSVVATPTSERTFGGRFEILGPDGTAEALVGTGAPVADAMGTPNRVVHVEFIDPDSGQTWLGATADWELRAGVWHWTMEFVSVADTLDMRNRFDLDGREVWAVACYDEFDAATGRKIIRSTSPFVLQGRPAQGRHLDDPGDVHRQEDSFPGPVQRKAGAQAFDDGERKPMPFSRRMSNFDCFVF